MWPSTFSGDLFRSPLRNILLSASMLTTCLIFIAATSWQLIELGPFKWHISIPETIQGGLEALIFLSALCALQFISNSKVRIGIQVVVSELYLRRHAVDLALVIDLLYLEILIAAGFAVLRFLKSSTQVEDFDYLKCFIIGVGTWSVLAWLLSALGFGSVRDLRAFTIILGLLSMPSRPKPFSIWILSRSKQMSLVERIALTLIFGWILILFARTNVAIGYDSLWYGYRGEHVLVGMGTAFESTGLVSNVFYYPKFYELLLIPVSGLGNTGVISGMTIMFLIMLGICSNVLLKRLGVVNRLHRIIGIFTCTSLPVVSNMALDPKPDIPEALFLMIAWLFAIDLVWHRRKSDALWMAACLIIATQAKLVAIPYAAALVLAAALGFFFRRQIRPDLIAKDASLGAALAAIVLASLTALLVTSRTIVTAGLPTITPDSLVRIWNALGFELKPPAGFLSITQTPNWSDTPYLLVDILFRPQVLGHMVITWIGNCWLWLIIAVTLAAMSKKSPSLPEGRSAGNPFAGLHVALILVGLYLMFGVGYGTRGSDGNYYLAAIVPAMLVGIARAVRLANSTPILRTTLFACLLCFSSFQCGYAFISADWSPGTRSFDANFGGGFHEYRKRTMGFFDWLGAGYIYRTLNKLHSSPSVVGCVSDEVSMRLPGRGQSIKLIRDMRPEYVDTALHFKDFLQRNKIDYLVMPNKNERNIDQGICSSMPWITVVSDEYASDPSIPKIQDRKYTMYRIRKGP